MTIKASTSYLDLCFSAHATRTFLKYIREHDIATDDRWLPILFIENFRDDIDIINKIINNAVSASTTNGRKKAYSIVLFSDLRKVERALIFLNRYNLWKHQSADKAANIQQIKTDKIR